LGGLHVGREAERLIWLNWANRPFDILGGGMVVVCLTFTVHFIEVRSGAKVWLICG
jgi:hypothetical protein